MYYVTALFLGMLIWLKVFLDKASDALPQERCILFIKDSLAGPQYMPFTCNPSKQAWL
jgi:hypothetical protein